MPGSRRHWRDNRESGIVTIRERRAIRLVQLSQRVPEHEGKHVTYDRFTLLIARVADLISFEFVLP